MTVSTNSSRREMQRRERYRRQLISRLFWGAAAILALAAVGFGVWQVFRQKPGVSIPVMGSQHIDVGAQHEPYNSDPPTSGPHYTEPARAGFYDEPLPEEQLIHNLEHGYVVIWYNCAVLEESSCETFKAQIQGQMKQAGSTKLIAVPRLSLDGPIAATTWGRLYKPETFDPNELLLFIKLFRYKAPEPNAP